MNPTSNEPLLLYCRLDLRRRGIKLSNSTLLRHEAQGRFPRRIRLGERSVAWIADEINAHIANLANGQGEA